MIKKVIFLPVGSYEHHGDLLPPATDSLISNRIAQDLNAIYDNSILLPVFNYGVSTEHKDFKSTITVDNFNYLSFMTVLLNSINAEDSLIVIINGHGGNANILSSIASEYNYNKTTSKLFIPPIYDEKVKSLAKRLFGEFDSHAGSVESSLMAYYNFISMNDNVIVNDEYVSAMPNILHYFRLGQISKFGIVKSTPNLHISSDNGREIHDEIIDSLRTDINNLLININKVI